MCEGVRFGLRLDKRGIVQKRSVLSNISSLIFLPSFLAPLESKNSQNWRKDSVTLYGPVESSAEGGMLGEVVWGPSLPPLQGEIGGELDRREKSCQATATSALFLKGVLISDKTLLGLTTVI